VQAVAGSGRRGNDRRSEHDHRRCASFSNFGTCLDLFAPGEDITSAWKASDTATNTISGTSMAAPHVAGAAALVLQVRPDLSPLKVRNQLVNQSTANRLSDVGAGSPNRLL